MTDASIIVGQGYNQIAAVYHNLRLSKKEINFRYFDDLFHYFPGAGKALDLGCGAGQPVTAYFAQKGFSIVGVDISPNMIEIAKKQVPSGEFFVSDMTECEFEDEEFDSIVSAFAIIHVPQEKQIDLFKNSLKQNVSLSKSPTQTETTQTNHFFAALCGYIKLEMLKVQTRTNHFALKTKLYVNALQSAFKTLEKMNPIQFSAKG
jgi:2-polyprenyl-3-methyl-5-hydroxy-6-metoxy-1,4-benzoquinol methylase